MKDLSPAARNLLSLARGAGAPTAAAQARVELALLERLASPIAASAMAGKVSAGKLGAGASAGKAAAGVTSFTTKVLFVAGVTSAVIALGVELSTPSVAPNAVSPAPSAGFVDSAVSPRFTEVPTPSAEAALESTKNVTPESNAGKPHAVLGRSASRPAEPAAVSQVSDAPRPARDPSPISFPVEQAERDAFDQPERTTEARNRDALPPPGPGDVAPARGNASDQLAAEAQGLREIQRALRDGNGQTALELVASDGARFSRGVLQQERAAAKIQALCLLGRAEAARTEALSFEQRWPRSPLLARVRSACR